MFFSFIRLRVFGLMFHATCCLHVDVLRTVSDIIFASTLVPS